MRRPQFIARQGRRPTGLLGKVVGWIMAHETAAANRVALDLLDLQPGDQVLEIGFGHGRSLAAAAAMVPDGFVAGIDHSEVMLRIARSRNACSLRSGRMELTLGDSERLPYRDGRFNKVIAAHTIYFWSDPQRQIGSIPQRPFATRDARPPSLRKAADARVQRSTLFKRLCFRCLYSARYY